MNEYVSKEEKVHVFPFLTCKDTGHKMQCIMFVLDLQSSVINIFPSFHTNCHSQVYSCATNYMKWFWAELKHRNYHFCYEVLDFIRFERYLIIISKILLITQYISVTSKDQPIFWLETLTGMCRIFVFKKWLKQIYYLQCYFWVGLKQPL